MEKYAIIVAGGIGNRMKKSIPKQFLLIKKKPVLLYSLEKFSNFYTGIKIIVVLPKNHIKTWEKLCLQHKINIKHTVIEGGKNRFFSVKNALKKIKNSKKGLVFIHDAVRPFFSEKILLKLFTKTQKKSCAIPSRKHSQNFTQN